jgi:YXWGXW repeat-containing protein
MKTLTALRRGSFALVLAAVLLGASSSSSAFVAVSVTLAPPPIPVYEQPLIPGPGYIWVPGYWAWGPEGYYWVPGTWVVAPFVGALWTPGYWGWDGGSYIWNAGYWGPRVGFYGGINYGFGYFGVGYVGGYWDRGGFYYNRACNNVNTTYIRNVYVQNVTVNTSGPRMSFNGPGGVTATPTVRDGLARNERRMGEIAVQQRHERAASLERTQFASVNHGVPSFTATTRPATDVAALRSGGRREARIERGAPQGAERFNAAPNREARIERGAPQGAERVNAGPPRSNREARIERAPQRPESFNAGPPRNNREARVERAPQGPQSVNAGPPPRSNQARVERAPQGPNAGPAGNREPRVERGGPPPGAGAAPQAMMRPQNAPQVERPQSPPEARGGGGGGGGRGERERSEERQK